MKLKKCQENQIFQKTVVAQCPQIKVKIVNFQIQYQTNLRQPPIRKTKLTKKEKLIPRKKTLRRLKKINKKDKLIVKSKRVNKKCVNKTSNN